MNLFQLCTSRCTLLPHTELWSVKTSPRAEASGMVRMARRKLPDWQGIPGLMSIMWKRKESSQQTQFSRSQVWLRISSRSFSVKKRICSMALQYELGREASRPQKPVRLYRSKSKSSEPSLDSLMATFR